MMNFDKQFLEQEYFLAIQNWDYSEHLAAMEFIFHLIGQVSVGPKQSEGRLCVLKRMLKEHYNCLVDDLSDYSSKDCC